MDNAKVKDVEIETRPVEYILGEKLNNWSNSGGLIIPWRVILLKDTQISEIKYHWNLKHNQRVHTKAGRYNLPQMIWFYVNQ